MGGDGCRSELHGDDDDDECAKACELYQTNLLLVFLCVCVSIYPYVRMSVCSAHSSWAGKTASMIVNVQPIQKSQVNFKRCYM